MCLELLTGKKRAPVSSRTHSRGVIARFYTILVPACAARSFAPLARAIRESRRRVGAMPQHVRMVALVVPVTFMCSASARSAPFHPCQHGQKSLLDDPQAVGRHVKARRTQRPRPQNPSPGWVNWPRNTGELRRRCPWCREFFLASAGLHDSTADSAFSWTPGGRRRTGRAASDRIIGPNDRLGDPIRCERRCF